MTLEEAKRRAVRELTDRLGPGAESLAIRIEGCKTIEDFRERVREAERRSLPHWDPPPPRTTCARSASDSRERAAGNSEPPRAIVRVSALRGVVPAFEVPFLSSLLRQAAVLLAAGLLAASAAAQAPVLSARSWLLVDANSGATLASHEPARRLEPASLTKLMTAYVVFVALGEKRIALDDRVTVSSAAFAAPGRDGARMFIEPGGAVTVDELLRGMAVVSGNDAAVALAEHTAGSQVAFVERMNAEARRLRLTDTHFANPTGLSDPQQYSTARDLARLAQRLRADFPQHMALFREREFTYNRIAQANRNRLLWSDASSTA